MSFGFSFGLPSWKTLSGGFTPASLFTNNEQGVWYEPAPNNGTLFQDSAGTTPVTGVEQFVGLMLDKSKGLVLGPELVTNGDFSSGTTGWTGERGGVLSVVSGALRVTQGSVTDYALGYQAVTLVIGQWYKLTVDFVGGTATNVQVGVGTSFTSADATFLATATSPRTLTVYFAATATTMYVRSSVNVTTNNVYADFDNFSLKAVSGNHAFQTNSLKRPKLAARYNLLTYSEEFDNGAWGKGGIDAFGSGSVVNATTAPDGTNTADLIKENTVNTSHWVRIEAQLAAASTQYVFSVYAKNIDRDYITVAFRGASSNYASATFNLTGSGAVSSSAALGAGYAVNSATISSVGNGWFRCVLTFTAGTNVSSQSSFLALSNNGALNTDGIPSYTGTGLTLYQWGADLRPASQATGLIGPTYQRVAAANVYDTAGFLPYLEFDGLDDSMSTGSIDFTATDKMTVWAGVRKLSDAARAALIELSSGLPAGSFMVEAPDTAAARYSIRLAGSSGSAQAATPSVYSAPITNVITPIFDLAAATNLTKMDMRINGADVAMIDGGGTVGAGNFGNYPLYIGARNNASLYFNGWLTSLIVRGAQSTQSQIEATEAWVNSRTGAY